MYMQLLQLNFTCPSINKLLYKQNKYLVSKGNKIVFVWGHLHVSVLHHCKLILKAFLLQLQNGTMIVSSLSTTSNSLQQSAMLVVFLCCHCYYYEILRKKRDQTTNITTRGFIQTTCFFSHISQINSSDLLTDWTIWNIFQTHAIKMQFPCLHTFFFLCLQTQILARVHTQLKTVPLLFCPS